MTRRYMGHRGLRIATLVVFASALLGGCTDAVYENSLVRDWDCGEYQLSFHPDHRYDLVASASGQHYSGTYQVREAPGGGHLIDWSGQTNAFTTENLFIQGPSSDRQMALGRTVMSTGTLCTGRAPRAALAKPYTTLT